MRRRARRDLLVLDGFDGVVLLVDPGALSLGVVLRVVV